MPFLGHAIMALAALLLLSAGWRVTSMIDRSGLERAAGTIVLAAATATLTALALGQLSLGANRWALLAAALVTAALARWRFPEPEVSLTNDLRNWWTSATPLTRVSVGAGLGAFSFLLINAFTKPRFGYDISIYHFPEVIKWVHSGRPGSIVDVNYDYPVGAYPLGGEVLMAWGAGMARSFVPMVLMKVLSFPLFAIAMVLLLRKVTDSIALKALAITALVLQPIMTYSTADYTGDVTATGWAALAAAFAFGSARQPRRLGIAFVAAGLSIGTKPLALAPLAIVLAWAAWTNRTALRAEVRWLAPLTLIGASIGGVWLLRNTIRYGWPLWPQQAASWGEPLPPSFRDLSTRLIDAPRETLSHDPKLLFGPIAGTAVLLVAGLAAPLWKPSKRVVQGSALLLLSVVLWAVTPGTGIAAAHEGFVGFGRLAQPVTELRYLAPAAVIAAACLAASGSPGWRRSLVLAILGSSTVLSVLIDLDVIHAPFYSVITPLRTEAVAILAASLAGGLLLWLAGAVGGRQRARPGGDRGQADPSAAGIHARWSLAGVVVSVAVVGALGTWAASGFVERWADAPQDQAAYPDIGMVQTADGDTAAGAMMRQPAWRRGSETVTFAAHVMMPALAGNDLRHDLYLLPKRARCSAARHAATRGWLVAAPTLLYAPTFSSFGDGYTGHDCAVKYTRIRFYGTPSIFRDPDPWVPPPGRQ